MDSGLVEKLEIGTNDGFLKDHRASANFQQQHDRRSVLFFVIVCNRKIQTIVKQTAPTTSYIGVV